MSAGLPIVAGQSRESRDVDGKLERRPSEPSMPERRPFDEGVEFRRPPVQVPKVVRIYDTGNPW